MNDAWYSNRFVTHIVQNNTFQFGIEHNNISRQGFFGCQLIVTGDQNYEICLVIFRYFPAAGLLSTVYLVTTILLS